MFGKKASCKCVALDGDAAWFETLDGVRVFLPAEEVPVALRVNDRFDLFTYWNQKGKPTGTRVSPVAEVGEYERMVVKAVTPVGAWLDWGIGEYLLLPSHLMKGSTKVDERVVVRVITDRQKHVATQKFEGFFSADVSNCRPADPVYLIVYKVEGSVAHCIVDGTWTGEIATNESHKGLKVGQTFNGYIREISEDNRLLLTLKMVGYKAAMEEAQVVLDRLEAAGGFLPLNDQSDPKEIRRVFSVSKKEFKKMLNGLTKQEAIEVSPEGIRLLEQ